MKYLKIFFKYKKTISFTLKYNLDRLICYAAFDSTWHIWDYFICLDPPAASSPRDPALAWTLALSALPFIVVGTLLTLRRLLNAALPRWMVSLFFFPLINLTLFGLLAIMPSSKVEVIQKEGQSQDVIDRPKQEVWNQLVTFNNMREPKEWLFRTGIAFPIRTVIEGKGVGSIRRCQFSTGDFVEPITVWNEPNLLRFSVQKMPPPLVELSFYKDLHLPHLENYFVSEKGQFKLTTLANGQTFLEGTTWYRHRIWPRVYWKLWSDYILHAIHLRVLNHIKREAESPQASET